MCPLHTATNVCLCRGLCFRRRRTTFQVFVRLSPQKLHKPRPRFRQLSDAVFHGAPAEHDLLSFRFRFPLKMNASLLPNFPICAVKTKRHRILCSGLQKYAKFHLIKIINFAHAVHACLAANPFFNTNIKIRARSLCYTPLFWRSDGIKIRTLKLVKGNGFRIVFVVQNEFYVVVVEVNGIYKAVNQCLFGFPRG